VPVGSAVSFLHFEEQNRRIDKQKTTVKISNAANFFMLPLLFTFGFKYIIFKGDLYGKDLC